MLSRLLSAWNSHRRQLGESGQKGLREEGNTWGTLSRAVPGGHPPPVTLVFLLSPARWHYLPVRGWARPRHGPTRHRLSPDWMSRPRPLHHAPGRCGLQRQRTPHKLIGSELSSTGRNTHQQDTEGLLASPTAIGSPRPAICPRIQTNET